MESQEPNRLRRGILVAAASAMATPLFRQGSFFSAPVASRVISNASVTLSAATIGTIAGVVHKALGVSTYPQMIHNPITKQNIPDEVLGRPYSYLRKVSDFDYLIPHDVPSSNVHSVSNQISTYFFSRLGALVRLFSYDENTLASAQVSAEWTNAWSNNAPELEAAYRYHYNFEDAERLGVLTHKAVTQEIISLMEQMIDLCKRADRAGYAEKPSPDCPTALDALAQNTFFETPWESHRVKHGQRSAFNSLNLSDHEKACLYIESIHVHDWLPAGKYIVYNERPGLIEIRPEILRHLSEQKQKTPQITERLIKEDASFSITDYQQRMRILRDAITLHFQSREIKHQQELNDEHPSNSCTEVSPVTLTRITVAARSFMARAGGVVASGLKNVFADTVSKDEKVHDPIQPPVTIEYQPADTLDFPTSNDIVSDAEPVLASPQRIPSQS